MAIGFSVVLMCAQGVSALSTTTDINSTKETTTDIYNATELSTTTYPVIIKETTTDIYNATELSTTTYPVIIKINNVDDLNMIGKNSSYPTDGNYELTDSFDASDFKEPIKYFNGILNGNCNTLYNTTHCLIKDLAGSGIVQHLTINGANTTNAACASAVVGTAKDNATIRFIRVEESFIHSTNLTKLGSVASILTDNGRIENVVVIDTEMELLKRNINNIDAIIYYGGVVGFADEFSKLNNITTINVNIAVDGVTTNIGGIVGYMGGGSHGRNLSAINTKVTGIKGSHINSGGVVAKLQPTLDTILLDDITCINITLIATTTKKESFTTISSGGVVGLVSELGDRSVKINRAFIISSHISARAFYYRLGCVFGHAYKLTSDNLACINTKIEGIHDSPVISGHGYSGGLFGRVIEGNTNMTALVMNSNISGFGAVVSYVGGVAGSGEFSSAMNNSVMFINSSLEDLGKIVKPCYSGSESDVDCLAKGVVFRAGQAFNTTNGTVYPYQYTMENPGDSCSWVELSFLSDSCITDEARFKDFQQSDRWDPDFCSMREQNHAEVTVHPVEVTVHPVEITVYPAEVTVHSAEVTVHFNKEDTDGKSTTLAVVSGGSGALLLSYCGCQWFVGCYKGDRGMDLIKRPITKVFCCCSCSEHSSVPSEDTIDEENPEHESLYSNEENKDNEEDSVL